jgi:murein DD-endopeptidase MepM/ murein hydrolase activator NlpD
MVNRGDRVAAGAVIGKSGFANAWHVHFMVNGGIRRSDGTASGVGDRDPMPYVRLARG